MRLVNFDNKINECLNKFLVFGIGDISVCKVYVLKFVVFIAAASLLLICLAKNTSGDLKIKKEKEIDKLRIVQKLRPIRND